MKEKIFVIIINLVKNQRLLYSLFNETPLESQDNEPFLRKKIQSFKFPRGINRGFMVVSFEKIKKMNTLYFGFVED